MRWPSSMVRLAIDARDRRANVDVGEQESRQVARSDCLTDDRRLRRRCVERDSERGLRADDLVACGLDPRLAGAQRGSRLVEPLDGHGGPTGELLGPRMIEPKLRELRFDDREMALGGQHGCLHLLGGTDRAGDRRLGFAELDLVLRAVEPHDQIALRDARVLLDRQLDDRTGDARRHLRDVGPHVGVVGRDVSPVEAPPADADDRRGGERDDSENDQDGTPPARHDAAFGIRPSRSPARPPRRRRCRG